MNQRQSPGPHAQKSHRAGSPQAIPAGFQHGPGKLLSHGSAFTRIKGGVEQIEARNHHAPPAQQRALGYHQVHNHVAPAQVIRLGLVGGRLIIPLQDVPQPHQYRGRAIGFQPRRLVKVVQEAQPAIEEEQ